MNHHGPLLSSILQNENQTEESVYRILIDLQYACSFIKIQDTKFKWRVLRNLLINGNFGHFKNVF